MFAIYLNLVTLTLALIITIKNNSVSIVITNSISQVSLVCFINFIVFINLTTKRLKLFVKLLRL